MERRRWLASLAGMAAVLILVAVALAAATRALGAAADEARSPRIADFVPRALLGRLAAEPGLSAAQRQSIRGLPVLMSPHQSALSVPRAGGMPGSAALIGA